MHPSEPRIAVRRSTELSRAPRARGLVRSIAAIAIAGLAFAPGSVAAGPSASPTPTTPIKHVVVLMQENHTFDNYFGTYPGANGPPASTCMPRDPTTPSSGCVAPYHLPSRRTVDLSHGTDVAAVALDNGKLDGFIAAQNKRNLPGETAMGYYDGSDLPFYWNLASTSVLADRFFSSDIGGSRENHMFWVAGQAGDPSVPAKGYAFDTIFDRLQAAGVDWKFYVQNYDPSITFRNLTGDPQDSQTIWVPLLNFNRFLDDPKLSSRIVDVSQYHEDLANGTLPAVAFIAPSGASEHPPGDVAIGQVYGASQVMALMESSSWSSSLFVLLWDDWGGWYDHVLPPSVDANGYGMRVPALFMSPYASAGRIDSTTYDFTSVLRFIEDNWQLQPMTARDAAANSVGTALDFTSTPRAPILPGPVYPANAQPNPRARVALLGIYGVVILVIPAGVWLWWRRRPWHAPATEELAVVARITPGAAIGAAIGAPIITTGAVAADPELHHVSPGQIPGAAALAEHVLPRLTSAGMVTPVAVHDGVPRSVAAIPATPIPLSPPAGPRAVAGTPSTPTDGLTASPAGAQAPARSTAAARRGSSMNATVAEPARGAGTKSDRKTATASTAQIRAQTPVRKAGRATPSAAAPAPVPASTRAKDVTAVRPTTSVAGPTRARSDRATPPATTPAPVQASTSPKGAKAGRATAASGPASASIQASVTGRAKPSRAKPTPTTPEPAPPDSAHVKRRAPTQIAPNADLGSPDATRPPRTTATAPAVSGPAPAPSRPRASKPDRTTPLPTAPVEKRKRAPSTREDNG